MTMSPPGTGDGYILVTNASQTSHVDSLGVPVMEALTSESWTEVVSRLVETYLVHVGPMIPIVTREDMSDVTSLLVHAMAAVAAARRNCPKEIFETLRFIVKRDMSEQGQQFLSLVIHVADVSQKRLALPAAKTSKLFWFYQWWMSWLFNLEQQCL